MTSIAESQTQESGREGSLPPLPDDARQEIRIAAALNGGVSLAIWMSGVTLELHHLALSSHDGVTPWQPYREILRVLGATARIDVIAGSSAGGLNGAFLGLALAHRRDLGLLRDLWTEVGSLEGLLRPALEKDPASLLQGDSYFLPRVTGALRQIVSDLDNPRLPGDDKSGPIELILTGTLWNGRESTFTDDMGVDIVERNHDALFRFGLPRRHGEAGNLQDIGTVVDELAAAGRCTSSFPGAFEPHWVCVDDEPNAPADHTWASRAGKANFRKSQYVVDGGVLLNKPLRPALDSIYQQTGDRQVRRVLAYVVPSPGEAPKPTAPVAAGIPATPPAGDVLLGVLTRLRASDSVARELEEIRDRNASVRSRRRARAALCQALTQAANMAEALWLEYRAERARLAASTISRLIARGQREGTAVWSERELGDALDRYAVSPGFNFIPRQEDLDLALAEIGDDWHWGQTTVGRLGDMTVDFLKRVVWFARLEEPDSMSTIVNCRKQVADVLTEIRRDRASLDEFWTSSAQGRRSGLFGSIPGREGEPNEPAGNLPQLDAWLATVIPAWDVARAQPPDTDRHDADAEPATNGSASATPASVVNDSQQARMHRQAVDLATILHDYRQEIEKVVSEPNPLVASPAELTELRALSHWFLSASDATGILERMLRLDVVHMATAGAAPQVEQAVELVLVSCSDPSVITGMQLHHFGAFYRASWRMNDWIEGRLDGAKQVMRLLLSPERLRQRGYNAPGLLADLRRVAAPDGPHHKYLEAYWEDREEVYLDEVRRALAGTTAGTALAEVADAVSMPVQLACLAEDLPALAEAIRGEDADAVAGSRTWLASYDARTMAARAVGGGAAPQLSAEDLWALREEMGRIGEQTIVSDVGSDTFARAVSHAATVATGLLAPPERLKRTKAMRFTLSTLRGYTAMIWTMVSLLTRRSRFGAHVVEMAVAVGGALLAVTLLVPGVPLALTLVGALLVLAGVTTASLFVREARGVGRRVAVACAGGALVLGFLVAMDIRQNHWSDSATRDALLKGAVGVGIVLFGSFVATARPSKTDVETTRMPAARRKRRQS